MAENVVGSVVYKIKGDTSQIDKSLNTTSQKLQGFGKGLSTFVTLPLIGAAGASAKLASDLGESINAVNVVFGNSADTITAWGKNAAEQAGLSKIEFNEAATSIGTLLKKSGKDIDAVALDTIELTKRAADLASVFNTDVSAATTALGAALRGESEPARRFGITLSDAAVQAKALELGLASTKDEITEAIKVQARYALILEESEQVAGDFENTNSETANSARVLKAQIENAAAELGDAFLPVIKDVLGVARDLVTGFNNLDEGGKNLVLILGGIAAAAGPAIQAGVWLYNNFDKIKGVLSGPVGIVALIGATVAGVTALGDAIIQSARFEQAKQDLIKISESTDSAAEAALKFAQRYDLSAKDAVNIAVESGILTDEMRLQTQELLTQQGIREDGGATFKEQLRRAEEVRKTFFTLVASSTLAGKGIAGVLQGANAEVAKGTLTYKELLGVLEEQRALGFNGDLVDKEIEGIKEILALQSQSLDREIAQSEAEENSLTNLELLIEARKRQIEQDRIAREEAAKLPDVIEETGEAYEDLADDAEGFSEPAVEGLRKVKDGLGSLLEELDAVSRYEFFENITSGAGESVEAFAPLSDAIQKMTSQSLSNIELLINGLNNLEYTATSLESLIPVFQQVSGGFTNLIANTVEAAIVGEDVIAAFGKAILKALAGEMLGLASSQGVQALVQTAAGYAALSTPYTAALAPGHFAAAGQHGIAAAGAAAAAGAISGLSSLIDSRQVGGSLVPLSGQMLQVNEGPTQERITVEQTTAQSHRGNTGGEMRLVISGGSDTALGQLISRMIQNGQIRGELR